MRHKVLRTHARGVIYNASDDFQEEVQSLKRLGKFVAEDLEDLFVRVLFTSSPGLRCLVQEALPTLDDHPKFPGIQFRDVLALSLRHLSCPRALTLSCARLLPDLCGGCARGRGSGPLSPCKRPQTHAGTETDR